MTKRDPTAPTHCDCGNKIRGLGKRCRECQDIYNKIRAIDRAEQLVPKWLGPAAPKDNPNRNPPHLAWIRGQPCCVCGRPGPSDPAHVRIRTGGGMGLKPSDAWTIPLCHAHHMQQHRHGHSAFDKLHGIDMRAMAEDYASRSPHLKKVDGDGPSVDPSQGIEGLRNSGAVSGCSVSALSSAGSDGAAGEPNRKFAG